VERFRGGLVFKADRLLYHSTVIQKRGQVAPFEVEARRGHGAVRRHCRRNVAHLVHRHARVAVCRGKG